MTVGVFHAGPVSEDVVAMARRLMLSIRATMPGVPIVHLTDEATPAFADADRVMRRPAARFGLAVLRHRASCNGHWLMLDTDTRVQQDVRSVFTDQAFDIAVATREGTLKPTEVGTKFMAQMPFNAGVAFSRTPAFWAVAAAWLEAQPVKTHEWMGDQRAMNAVIAGGRFRVQVLPATYNYPPRHPREDVSAHAIVHFKGDRKAWGLRGAA